MRQERSLGRGWGRHGSAATVGRSFADNISLEVDGRSGQNAGDEVFVWELIGVPPRAFPGQTRFADVHRSSDWVRQVAWSGVFGH